MTPPARKGTAAPAGAMTGRRVAARLASATPTATTTARRGRRPDPGRAPAEPGGGTTPGTVPRAPMRSRAGGRRPEGHERWPIGPPRGPEVVLYSRAMAPVVIA